MYLGFLFVLFMCIYGGCSKRLSLPAYLKPCSRNSPDFDQCVLQHGKDSIPSIVKGDKTFGIPKLNPLSLTRVELGNDNEFKLTISDVKVYGLPNADLKELKIDLDKRNILVKLYFNEINVIGDYDINGNILIIPIQGNGDINMTAVGLEVRYGFGYTLETKDGDAYISVKDVNTDFDLKRAYFKLENLFNGNEMLGASTNQVLNDEWEKFIEALKPAIISVILEVANNVLKGILPYVPYDELFPNK